MKIFIHTLLILFLPMYIVGSSALGLLSETWIQYQYSQENFPSDSFGMSTQQRLSLAIVGLDYVTGSGSKDELQTLELENSPAFNQREVDHLEDVRVVIGKLKIFVFTFSLILLGLFIVSFKSESFKSELLAALSKASLTLLAVLIVLGISISLFWSSSFDVFHSLLFERGSWQFYEADLLIRLYPERLWFASAVMLGIISGLNSVLIYFSSRRLAGLQSRL